VPETKLLTVHSFDESVVGAIVPLIVASTNEEVKYTQSVPLDIAPNALKPTPNHLFEGPVRVTVTVDVEKFLSIFKVIKLFKVTTPVDFVCAIETFSPTNKAIAK
jgi:hypothetical protein